MENILHLKSFFLFNLYENIFFLRKLTSNIFCPFFELRVLKGWKN